MLPKLESLLTNAGLAETLVPLASRAIAFLLLLLASFIAYYLVKRVLLRVVGSFVKRTPWTWDDKILESKVFAWSANLVPALLVYLLAPAALEGFEQAIGVVRGAARIYLIIMAVLTLDSLINAGLLIYNGFPISREVPLKIFAQVAKIILYLIGVIVIFSALLGKSPTVLLGSMGVLASVLMLVFKDSILGFVAGLQLSGNKMLSKGDWIEMPKYGADGNVIDVALTTVKVRNWDNTITTVPTYALISDSFKNWRGMSESGGRRIKRSILVDMSTIRLATPEMLERFSKIQHIAEYIAEKKKALAEWNLEKGFSGDDTVNSRRLTNVGTFRAYIEAYLKHHPRISQDLTLLVRQLQPAEHGLPIEIYCFSSDKNWINYEAIQSDIFDHILAVAPEFDLRIFQNPSGADFRELK